MARDSMYVRFALRVLGEISAIIIIPAVAVVIGTRAFQARGGSSRSALILVAAAFVLTMAALVRRIYSYGREFNRLSRDPQDHV